MRRLVGAFNDATSSYVALACFAAGISCGVFYLLTHAALQRIMGIQRFKRHLSDSVVNADNASLSSMDTTSFLSVFDDADEAKGSKKSAGGGAKAIARELEKVF